MRSVCSHRGTLACLCIRQGATLQYAHSKLYCNGLAESAAVIACSSITCAAGQLPRSHMLQGHAPSIIHGSCNSWTPTGHSDARAENPECGQDAVGSWGNEYVRNLAAEIASEFNTRKDAEESVDDLLSLVAQIVPYHMSHNAGQHIPQNLMICFRRLGRMCLAKLASFLRSGPVTDFELQACMLVPIISFMHGQQHTALPWDSSDASA